jgi:putative transposase
MLTHVDLLAWYTKFRLVESARVVIDRIRASDPARRVGGGRRNVSGFYPSKKMGVTIQFESHRVELAAVYELEHDDAVLEYFDQPPSFKLEYDGADGRHMGVLHTADYFVIRRDCAGWEECKTEDELVAVNRKSPSRYARNQQGRWICPPGEAHAAALGLYYRVRSSREIDWVYHRNIQFLEDYLRDRIPTGLEAHQAILAQIGAAPGISLDALFDITATVASRDDIYAMIARGDIHVDFSKAPVSEPSRVHVFTSKAAARLLTVPVALESAIKPGSIVIATSDGSHRTDEIRKRLVRASERELRIANDRLRLVTDFLTGEQPEGARVAGRTLRRWLASYRSAERELGSGYLGLLPRPPRGNAAPKLPQETRDMMKDFITTDYENLKQKTRYASWIALKLACERRGIIAPSFKTFCLAVRSRSRFEQTAKRQGHRAAYAHEEFYWELELTTPRHGDRPFEIVHIDHTQLDVEIVCSRTGRVLGRPWLTLLIDAFSRRILALYLTFDPPSYRSCMMVLRDCVRRHARLPQFVIEDGGREFESTYFETLLARYECTKKTRPPAKARFGSVLERMFGTCNTQFIHNLRGNTQITRNVRQVTASVNPKGLGTWTLHELNEQLTEYLLETYDRMEHPALGQSPQEAFAKGFEASGLRLQRLIPYDQNFILCTLPSTAKGTATLCPGRGVKINHVHYWSDVFRDSELEARHLPVRYDPFDAGMAYAFCRNQWVECHSEYYMVLHGRSEREMMLAAEEIRKRHRLHSARRLNLNAKTLALFLESVEAQETLLAQRTRDQDSAAVRSGINPERSPQHSMDNAPIRFENAVSPVDVVEIYGEF